MGETAVLTRFRPLEPSVFAAMAGGCLAVAVGAAWLPARRALAVEPRSALDEG